MFFNKTQATKQAQNEFSDFLELISPSLQLKIYDTIYSQMMKKNVVVIKILDSKSTQVVVDLKIKKTNNFSVQGLRNLGGSLRDQGRKTSSELINLKGKP